MKSPDAVIERESNPMSRLGLFANQGNPQYSCRNT
jgi:hypothetical protein